MFGGELYSSRMARTLVSVRKRIRPPLGQFARLQTSLRNSGFNRTGKRINSPPFSLNHGRPLISKPLLVNGSQRSLSLLEALPPDPIVERSFVGCATALGANDETASTQSTARQSRNRRASTRKPQRREERRAERPKPRRSADIPVRSHVVGKS